MGERVAPEVHPDRLGRIAPAPIRPSQPIAKLRHAPNAAGAVAEATTAQHRAILLADQQERVAAHADVAGDPTPDRWLARRVGHPPGLPHRIPVATEQVCEVVRIGERQRTQQQPRALRGRHALIRPACPRERNRPAA